MVREVGGEDERRGRLTLFLSELSGFLGRARLPVDVMTGAGERLGGGEADEARSTIAKRQSNAASEFNVTHPRTRTNMSIIWVVWVRSGRYSKVAEAVCALS